MINMKINYPIKYAAMPIIEQVGWSHGIHDLERKYDVVCHIVSKCYLISDLTKYTEDGCSIREYEVVFPYQHAEFNRWKRVIPTYNLIHGYCTNSNKIDMVFDSYEEAVNHVSIKNEKLCEKSLMYMPYSDDYAEKIRNRTDEFAAKLTEYKVLEEQILLHTDDIKIGQNKQLHRVVRISNDSAKVLSCNIYQMLELFDKDKFVAYTVSQKQYDNLINLINQEKIDDIKAIKGSAQGLLIHKTKDDFIKLAIEDGCGAYYLQNNCIKYDCTLDKVTKDDFDNIDDDTLIFYTTETIEDILNSYKNHSEIDLEKNSGHVLKKTK